MKTFLKLTISVFAVFILFKSCGPSFEEVNSMVSQPAPDFTSKTLNGRNVAMSSLRAGQPAILFFWASWCPHCRKQLSELNQQRADIEEKGIKLVLINVEEDPRKIEAYFKAEGISFDTFLDLDGFVAGAYNVVGFPMFFFVNRGGIIVATGYELRSDYEKTLLGFAP